MKLGDFLIGALVGGVVYHIYIKSRQKAAASNPMTLGDKVKLASDVVEQESLKYSDILKKEYDIIMPSDQINKKVRERGAALTQRRKEINLNKIKEPVSI
jgi:molybdate-binding protein